MDFIYGWVDDQRRRNRSDFYRFSEEQRAKWLPHDTFNRCCVKWLADGKYTPNEWYADTDDPYSFRDGCAGNCRREHPQIVLSFDAATKTTVATISHPQLLPFQKYFQERMSEETAWVRDRSSYDLNGFIRENLTNLRSQRHFGAHLVSLADGALEASDAAQREQEERPVKRAKTCSPPPSLDLLEKVMDVALLEGLAAELDLFSLYCMRHTSRLFCTIATRIATSRLKTAKFHITPLVDGMERHGESIYDGFDDETWEVTYDSAVRYEKCDNVVLQRNNNDDDDTTERLGEASFVPTDPSVAEFRWKSDYLYDDASQDDDYKRSPDDYHGQKLRVFWHPEAVDGVQEKKRVDFQDESVVLPPLGVEIGTFYVGKVPKIGLNTLCENGVTVEFEVLESSEERVLGLDEDEPDEYCTCYSGRARIIKLQVDFGTLVRIHALELLPKVKRDHARIERERPLRASELAYVQTIEAAAKPIVMSKKGD